MRTLRRRTEGLMVRELDQELLVLDTESDQIHQLNETAAFIWRCCGDVPSVEAISRLLAEEYSVEIGTANKDVDQALCKFRELRLIVES